MDCTTISLSTRTRDRLRERKRDGDNYDDVVQRLLDETGS